MLLLDSEALSAISHGPAARRDSVRALIGIEPTSFWSGQTFRVPRWTVRWPTGFGRERIIEP